MTDVPLIPESSATSFSTNGPKCPQCGFTFTPDERYYYERGYDKDECQECGCKFKVEVHYSVSWECEAIDDLEGSMDPCRR